MPPAAPRRLLLPRPGASRRGTPRPGTGRAARTLGLVLWVLAAAPGVGLAAPGDLPAVPEEPAALRRWIEEIRAAPRGPFERLRWFCADGSVLPPEPYACAGHGGGVQHGEWSARVRALRAAGYRIANVLADLDASEFTGPDADLGGLAQILVERFLVRADQGWIFRGARTYRGALQVEDERAGARRVVRALLGDSAWRDSARWLLLRETVRLLPRSEDAATLDRVRRLATEVAERDPAFEPLRARIHNAPAPGDADRVRAHAARRGVDRVGDRYARLAASLEALHASRSAPGKLRDLADRLESGGFGARPPAAADSAPSAARADASAGGASPSASPTPFASSAPSPPAPPGAGARDPRTAAAETLRRHAQRLEAAAASEARFAEAAGLLAFYRDRLTELGGSGSVASDWALVEASLALEDEVYAAGAALAGGLAHASRRQRLAWLESGAEALYGAGFFSRRHRDEVHRSLARLWAPGGPAVGDYRDELRYLARGAEWAGRWLDFHVGPAVERLAELEPRARLYPPERLRASPLLFYSRVVDGLVADANRLAGVGHRIFGTNPGAGVRALNPGLARGVLGEVPPGAPVDDLRPDGLYLLDSTVADLPPVAGILARGEGNALSHVQLLARNLGIPNVVVGEGVLPAVRAHLGSRAVLAVSPGGAVELVPDGPAWDEVFDGEKAGAGQDAPRPSGEARAPGEGPASGEAGGAARAGGEAEPRDRAEGEESDEVRIHPDLEKLDLSTRRLVPLSELRASDSGRIAGPKSANLGELAHHFGDAVPEGFVIPFGVFRAVLERPLVPGAPSVWRWMRARFAAIGRLEGEGRKQAVRHFLGRLRAWILDVELDPAFRERFFAALRRTFGPDGTYGVFVRSDTNVEDLPGFAGAGLNLTVPNVVGEEAILEAVKRVWASPFTERAYAWRQERMTRPAYVFPAVLVQRAVPAEKSGVLVTVDVDTGSPAWLTIAANEGVGGAVEGQGAETLRVRADGSAVRFLSRATAPFRTVLDPGGGVARRPASGTARLLGPEEIQALVELAREAPARFPALRREGAPPRPADIEFAFAGGRLHLLQLRPFVESRRARTNAYLRSLDAALEGRGGERVDLDAVPPLPKPADGAGAS